MTDGYRVFRTFPPLKDPNSLPPGPVLAVAPHPDDEIIGCGGTLAFHVDRGDDVIAVQMTGGERGDPQNLEHRDLVEVRRQESRQALQRLGVESLVGLGFADGSVPANDEAIERVGVEIEQHAPSVVYAPSPLECHPDHLATCWVVAEAVRRSRPECVLACYEVNHPTLASWLLDITPRVERKRESLLSFASQQRYQDIVGKCLAGAYARTVNIEMPEFQYAEAFLELDPSRLHEVWAGLEALSKTLGIAVDGSGS